MRGKAAKKREIKPDFKYKNEDVTKFINFIMQDGKKETAEKIVYTAIDGLKAEKKGEDGKKVNVKPLEVFLQALDNVKPKLEIRSRRIGGANYQVPVPVSPDRQKALAMRWIINIARDGRKNTPLSTVLKNELLAAFNNEGNAVKKKEDTQKMADANKAFAQFA